VLIVEKKKVIVFEEHDERIGSGAVLSPLGEIRNGVIGVIEVEGIAVGSELGHGGSRKSKIIIKKMVRCRNGGFMNA